MGVGREELVGVQTERGLEHLVWVLGTLKAGASDGRWTRGTRWGVG